MVCEGGAGGAAPAAFASLPPRTLAARMADAVIARRPAGDAKWGWEDGLVAAAISRTGRETGSAACRVYASRSFDRLVDAEGRIAGWNADDGDLSQFQPGSVLLSLLRDSPEDRLHRAVSALWAGLRRQPRTRAGGFWGSRSRPFQMWLDSIALAAPFYAGCAASLAEPEAFDDAAHQLLLMEQCARDPRTGLLAHAWDESRRQLWSNPESGRSPSFWTRAMGLFGTAAVDTAEILPPAHPDRPSLVALIERLAHALFRWQDPSSGLWFQVTDQPGRRGNFTEASGTCLLVIGFSKALRLGMISGVAYEQALRRAYEGVVTAFIREDPSGFVALTGCCGPVSLGGNPYQDGSFACYCAAPLVQDEPAATAAFILASLERDSAASH